MPRYSLPEMPSPQTVSRRDQPLEPVYLSLDEAIRTALRNGEVVRVLVGTTAVSSGRTIYDAAITNTQIDEQNARFDPRVTVNQSWNRNETPSFNPLTPPRTDNYTLDASITKENALGGTWRVGANTNPTRVPSGASTATPSADLSYTQPLLRGGGIGPNLAPIVISRIDTERSFFQFKDAMQEQLRGVVEGYWSLVAARVDVWARQRQVEQARDAYRLVRARFETEIASRGDLALSATSLANFQANLVSSEANLIQREAALRNLLGLPPSDGTVLVPSSPPNMDRFVPEWQTLCDIAAERRPDLIELKLVLEADQQLLIQSRNNALPQVDAVGLYRWNGLEGELPGGIDLVGPPGQFQDWTLGVNFSVPLGLRQSRAGLRRTELLIARDRANLQQGLHAAVHSLASSVRTLDQAYELYQAFQDARRAARINLDQQLADYRAGRVIFLNVLQAITSWGDAVSAEAGSLTSYNSQLADLEQQAGTILETHGVVFVEERYGSIRPLGRLFPDACYPSSLRPGDNEPRYPLADEPAEQSFDLGRAPGFDEVTPPLLPELPYEDVLPRRMPRDSSLPPPVTPDRPAPPPREPMSQFPAGRSRVVPATATQAVSPSFQRLRIPQPGEVIRLPAVSVQSR
ncbi:MAG TPA: TolC family protein [Pirellulaceae bacterium]|nr:TolC family protein [Pirellulaceae bacterium]